MITSVLIVIGVLASCVLISGCRKEPDGNYNGLPVSHLDSLNEEQKEEMLKKAAKLREAATVGDTTQILEILKSGVVIDYPDDDGRSALCLAVLENKPEACTCLLKAGAYPTVGPTIEENLKVGEDFAGYTPANYATLYEKVLQAFLDAGVSMEEIEKTPSQSMLPIKKIPIRPIDEKDIEKYTSQNKGLPVKYMRRFSETQREEMIKKLEKLREAAGKNDVATIKQLIKSGVVIDYPATRIDDQSALHVAAENNHLEACKTLLEAGATSLLGEGLDGGRTPSSVALDTDGYRPVEYAVNNPKLLQVFLNAKVPVNSRGNFDRTLLHHAVEADAIDSVRLLIKNGADVNAITRLDLSPPIPRNYSVISCARSTTVLEELLKNGAKPSQEDIDDLCVEADNGDKAGLPKILNKYGYKQSKESILIQAARKGDAKALADVVKKRVNVNCSVTDNVLSPLHYAAQNGHVDCVNILIKAGANIEAQDYSGATPLFLAANCFHPGSVMSTNEDGDHLFLNAKDDHLDCVNALIKAGANVNAQDKHGYTALSRYVSSELDIRTAKALLEAGADPTIKNKNNSTAIDSARGKKMRELLKQYVKPKK